MYDTVLIGRTTNYKYGVLEVSTVRCILDL